MGFTKLQSEGAIKKSITVQAALESLIYNSKTEKCSLSFKNFVYF